MAVLGIDDVDEARNALLDGQHGDMKPIVSAPIDGPIGRTFTFADLYGYRIALHSRPDRA